MRSCPRQFNLHAARSTASIRAFAASSGLDNAARRRENIGTCA
jgi:hypothetical protein